jgi:hypothetical protein
MQIILENADKWDTESLTYARRFCLTLEDFDFNFNLIIFGKILPLSKVPF